MENFSTIICLANDTLITTPIGRIPICNINVGWSVYTYNFNFLEIEETIVERTAKSFHSAYAEIVFYNNKTLKCTIDHPIYVKDKGFCSVDPEMVQQKYGIKVNKLKVSDICYKMNGLKISDCRVKNISIVNCREWFYIISGGKNNNFFANNILTHDENIMTFELQNNYLTQIC